MTEWTRTVVVDGPDRTQDLAERLGSRLRAGDLLVLTGELGAGKTTFTQGLGRGLGVRSGIISPTFVLVRRHPNAPDGPRPGGPDLVHVDAYRLATAGEIDDIDLEDTVETAVTVVEWGTGKVEHLAESRLEIVLERAVGAEPPHPGRRPGPDEDVEEGLEDDAEPRRITLTGIGPRWAGGPPRLD